MTVTLNRPVTIVTPTPAVPTVDIAAVIAAGCPDGVPWCCGDRDWHDIGDGESNHDSGFVVVPTDAELCTKHDETPGPAHEVWLAIEREDVGGEAGTPRIWMSAGPVGHVCDEDAHLSLDRAEQLADEILRLVAAARGAKRAADLRIGDVVVIDGVEQTVNLITHDGLCCANRETGVHECDGSLTVETDVSGDCEPAATFELDDLVPVRVSE